MPIYEYVCHACGEKTEALQRLSDPPLTDCPKDGGHLERVFSLTNAHTSGADAAFCGPSGCGPEAAAMGGCGMGACGTGMCGVGEA
jgi:putative FmdB family regulatory protein